MSGTAPPPPAGESSSAPAGTRVTVAQGDTMVSLAHAHGFRDWRVIYDHPENDALRRRRPRPEQLLPGDEVFIPPLTPVSFDVPLNQEHQVVLRRLVAHLRLQLVGPDGVLARSRFEVRVEGEGQVRSGVTDDGGNLDVALPPDATEALLRAWRPDDDEPLEWTLALGHLDPLVDDAGDTVESGARGRLLNLGYEVAEGEGGLSAALKVFQRDQGLEPTGEPDEVTRARLEQQSGS